MALPSQDIQALANAADERKRQEQGDSFAEEALMTGGGGSVALFKARQAAAELANEAAERQARPLTHNQGRNLNGRGTRAQPRTFTGNTEITGPRGGSSLPPQPSLDEARTAQTRSAYSARSSTTGANLPEGATSSRGTGTTGGSTTRGVLNSAKNSALVQGSKRLATGFVSAPAVQGLGAYETGNLLGKGADILGGYSDKLFGGTGQRPSEYFANLAEYMMERAYGTGLDAEGNPTGGAYDTKNENSFLGDLSDLFIKGVNNSVKAYDAVDRQLAKEYNQLQDFNKKFEDYLMGGLQNSEEKSDIQTLEFRDVNNNGIEDRDEGLQVTQLNEEKVLPFQPAEGTPEVPTQNEVPMQNPNRGSSNKVPAAETEAEPLTGLDLYNDMYGKLMQKQDGKISDEQIKFARKRASEEGFGLDPEKGFFKQDFEGQDFEGQTIGEYLSVEFKPRKGAIITNADTYQQGKDGGIMLDGYEMPNRNSVQVRNPFDDQDNDLIKTVRTLDPNTGEMIFADQETANDIADFYARQRRGEALTRQEALESGAMRDFSNRQLRNVIDSEYSRESRAREDRIANRPDFNETFGSSSENKGEYTNSNLREIFGDNYRQAKAMVDAGIDPMSGKRINQGPEPMSEYQRGVLDLEEKKFEQDKIESAKPETMSPYQKEMVDLAKNKYKDAQEEAKRLAEIAKREGATQAEKDELDIAQKRVNLSQSYLDLIQDSKEVPEDLDLNFEKFESKLDVLEDTMDIEFDHRTKTFYKGRKGNTILPNSQEGKIMAADPFFQLVFDQYPVKK